MKKVRQFICCLLVVLAICACNNTNYPSATTALEGGREFIDACLKGDFKKASSYMIDDSTNSSELLKLKRDYNTKGQEEKHAYGTASIIIMEDATINDLTHIINYKNSYDNIARKVKVVNSNGKWLVDLKYTFNGNL
jgi:hypothetical protein